MKTISNSSTQRIFFIITLIMKCMFASAQNERTELLGCWTESSTGAVYENLDGSFVETSWGTKGNSLRKMMLLPDSIGAYYDEPNILDKDCFSWWATDSTLIFHESPECPYIDKLYYRIVSSETCDTLLLEHRYKNPNYRTRDTYVRKKISIGYLGEHLDVKINRTDYYIAYKKRIIYDQKPYVYSGYYQNNHLKVGRQVANWLNKLTVSDIVEIHIINPSQDNKNRIDIFLISYDYNSKQIKNINYIDSYYRNEQ